MMVFVLFTSFFLLSERRVAGKGIKEEGGIRYRRMIFRIVYMRMEDL